MNISKWCDMTLLFGIKITVIGIDGKQIMNRAASGKEAEVNIDNYPAGVYLIKVRTSDEVISKKIVKF